MRRPGYLAGFFLLLIGSATAQEFDFDMLAVALGIGLVGLIFCAKVRP